ncbi:hypothetical protein HID58_079792 [Brassica napus]|uniref:Uncharacterized protein n=1 Tax=Brassica napus TaxID=3708 RepID=A0ABQ7Y345_BRANA|nr:hypothetical protein HID58_079792 [Brassica napus]
MSKDSTPPERSGVFSRVQLPQEQMTQEQSSRQSSLMGRESQHRYASSQLTRHHLRTNLSGSTYDNRGSQSRSWEDKGQRGHYSDRIIKRRHEYNRSNRDGGTRHSTGPYDRRKEQTWIVKSRRTDVSEVDQTGYDHGEASREIVSYEHVSAPSHVNNSAGGSSRKLASTIITPVREPPMVENVTLRTRGEARSLTFSPSREKEPSKAKDQIIEALLDMELVDQQDGDMLDAEGIEDDLLGLDLMEMEDNGCRDEPPEEKGRTAGIKSIRHMKLGVKQSAPLGIPSRKFEILLRGSPSKRSSSTGAHAPGAERCNPSLTVSMLSREGLKIIMNLSEHNRWPPHFSDSLNFKKNSEFIGIMVLFLDKSWVYIMLRHHN